MVRDNLGDVPCYPLPEEFALRTFRPGDEATWVAIHQDAEKFIDVTRETFDRNFGHDLEAMKNRCFLLVAPGGRDVGTGPAWYDKDWYLAKYGK